MTTRTRQQIIAEESAKFMDLNFGQLDLSGFPDLQRPAEDKFEPHDKDGLNRVDLSGMPMTNKLKEFISSPDAETLERVALETGDPELIAKVEEERREAEAQDFMAAHPDYHRCQRNYDRIKAYLEEHRMEWTAHNLHVAYRALSKAGELLTKPGTARPLTEHDRRAVALQAASGDVEGAVTRYLLKRLPEGIPEVWMYATSPQEAMDEIADPTYKRILDEAVWFCWEHGRPNYSPTPERRRFMNAYIAGRIATARLLDEAWRACQDNERAATRDAVLAQVATQSGEPEELDGLTDQQVDTLYHASLREFAQQARGAGIYQ